MRGGSPPLIASSAILPAGLFAAMGDAALRREIAPKGLARAATFTWDRTARQVPHIYRDV